MTRRYMAVVAAFLAAVVLSAPVAQACISCSYTPEVVNTPVGGAKAKKKGATAKKAPSRPAKKRVVKKAPPAKAPEPEKSVAAETPAVTPAEPESDTEAVESASSARSGTATAAFAEREAARAQAAAGVEEAVVGCKRYSAQAGTTVTVPCE